MSPSFDFPSTDRFLAGTIGLPGDREFYLQVVANGAATTFKVEKQQVAMLAEHLARVLVTHELPSVGPAEFGALEVPLQSEWTIGSMMVAINESEGRVVVIGEELLITDEDAPADEPAAEVRVALSREQVEAFVDGAQRLVEAGRPICRLCGGPIDPEGHACPRLN